MQGREMVGRPPGEEDVARIAELFSRDAPEPMSVELVRRLMAPARLDTDNDARITDVAVALLVPREDSARLDLAGEVTPELLAWAEDRARQIGVARLVTATWAVEGAIVQLLEASGWSPIGFGLRMRTELAGRTFSPRFPDGIAVRTFREGDEERVYRTHFETFQDVSQPTSVTFEAWSQLLLKPPLFHPDLWFLAEEAGELAGIALCDPHPSGVGHVGVLGVRAPWRGRGIGLALLEHSFAEFAARDFPAVILGAEAGSPTGADRLYERAGMRQTHRRARYEKALS